MVFVKQSRAFPKHPDGVDFLTPIAFSELVFTVLRIGDRIRFTSDHPEQALQQEFDLVSYVKLAHQRKCVCAQGQGY